MRFRTQRRGDEGLPRRPLKHLMMRRDISASSAERLADFQPLRRAMMH